MDGLGHSMLFGRYKQSGGEIALQLRHEIQTIRKGMNEQNTTWIIINNDNYFSLQGKFAWFGCNNIKKKDNLVVIEDIYDVPLTKFSSRL